MPKTYVIYGLLTRSPTGRGRREPYAYTNLVYNVDDSVSFEDVEYIMQRIARIKRSVPYDIRTNEKLDYVIGLDKERSNEGGKVLSRLAFNKKFAQDLNNLDWVYPQ